jgi:hypothetical protein
MRVRWTAFFGVALGCLGLAAPARAATAAPVTSAPVAAPVTAAAVTTAPAAPVATAAKPQTTAAKPQAAVGKPLRKIDFNRDIRPIFSENCYACHGPDKGRRKADLRLDTKDGLFGMKDDSYPVVPGKIDDSVLYLRITSDDPDTMMPEKTSNKHLTPHQKELIKRWIEEGAEWKGHWAYVPPERAKVPNETIPGFTRNPIDQFIAEKLTENGLKPSAEADRVTLIRRVTFDLIGLPPTPAEVSEFVNDRSPNAYEKVVDRLLKSPHFGERMAVYWMDLVRYADTIGYHSDNPRQVWPYRDWVINAFNRNEPFDQFTIEQLAGDLLPNATRDQKVASGYNRLLLTTEEGGAQAKEYIVKYEGDRVRNVSTVWMGATLGCANCHDHKFDPYTQKDFFRMAAFFADIQEPAIGAPVPELQLPDEKQSAELTRLDGAIAAVNLKLATTTPEIAAAQAAFEKQYAAEKSAIKWEPLEVTAAKSAGGATLTIGADQHSVLASGTNPATDAYTISAQTKLKGITAIRLEVLPHDSLPSKGPGRAGNGNFVLTELDVSAKSASPGATTQPVAFTAATASVEQTFGAEASPYRKWSAQAAVDGDKYGPQWGWAILDKTGIASHAVFETAFDLGDGTPMTLNFAMKFNHGDAHTLGHFRLMATTAPRPVRATADKGIPAPIVAILDTPEKDRTEAQKTALAAHFRSIAPQLAPVRQELAKLTADKTALVASIPKMLISVSGQPRVTRVLHRGDWQDDKGEIVTPGVPAFMKQIDVPPERGASRLDLAKWMVARDNPMTARVFVNRIWKMLYGQGIAKPLDDIGSQGDWPTHQELLDWLAVEFMDSGWDVKHIMQLMVMSGTYRQSSTPTKEQIEKDPYNKWLAHQGTFRLDAEFVRDNALAVAGLLVDKIGGPSVKPYQPAGYWSFLNFPKREYDQDHGEKLYRRGLYTWWQRTFMNPTLMTFDAPSHEECTAERTRSNTPQQALVLLNDPTFVEAARVFAQNILKCGAVDDTAKLEWAYHQALSRPVSSQEVPVLEGLLAKHRKHYAADKKLAEQVMTNGESPAPKDADPVELAAWTSVARTILNLHETITRN